ncbi:MAG TPA: GAF domain-containing protein [Candidatus Acidoferrales bacterium]|nr:GAF domain-containing protein [Candidatus Acidoferrales bacterium]
MNLQPGSAESRDIEFLHELGERIASADPLHRVLLRILDFIASVMKCDSCLVYVLEGNELVLRASKNPHADVVDRLRLRVGQGITGWVAQNKKPVLISCNAAQDARFQAFNELPEDRFEAFLSVPVLCRDRVVGVINVQHREPHAHSHSEIQLISTIGFLVGPEIDAVRRDDESSKLSEPTGARKMVQDATRVLQRDLGISEEEAFLALQKQSRERRKSMREIADAILLSDEINSAPDSAMEAP